MATRLYVYTSEVRVDGRTVHRPGEAVTQAQDATGYWRDVDALRCVSGDKCQDVAYCHCRNCRIYQDAVRSK